MDYSKIISLLSIVFFLAFCAIAFFIIRGIWRAFKRFTFEVIDHIKGANTSPSRPNYTDEARRAREKTTPKKDKYATPPWEE